MSIILDGPFDLSFESIERTMPKQRVGVFAIGHVDSNGVFRVQRVGRDDADLQGRLRGMIGSGNQFKFVVVSTAQEAFDLECDLFHRFKPRGNFTHPDRPRGSSWKCDHCLQLHL